MEETTRLIIIEDNEVFGQALTLLVNNSHRYEVIQTYTSCEQAIANLLEDAPSIVIMDLNLPEMSGVEGTKVIKRVLPEAKVLIISAHGDKEAILEAFAAGATGYITKDADYVDFMEAIKEVEEGGAPMSKSVSKIVVDSFHSTYESPLTERETQVLQLVSMGKTYKEIANQLFIHPETVKSHLKNIYSKLNVHNKADAIMKAVQEKLFNFENI